MLPLHSIWVGSREALWNAAGGLAGHVGIRAACRAERAEVFGALCSPRFADRARAVVYAMLLDEGVYLCSERTMYRVLAENQAVRERRAQRSHPNHPKPEVVARAPKEVWSWDITRLLGPEWQYFYLYVILDIYSRYATGWMVAERETAGLAGHLVGETCLKHGVQPRVLNAALGPVSAHDGQVHGAAPGRPGRHAVAGPPQGLERQPVLGGALQDHHVPPGLPRPVRLHRGPEGLLPGVLPVVQHRATARRHRPADAGAGPPWAPFANARPDANKLHDRLYHSRMAACASRAPPFVPKRTSFHWLARWPRVIEHPESWGTFML